MASRCAMRIARSAGRSCGLRACVLKQVRDLVLHRLGRGLGQDPAGVPEIVDSATRPQLGQGYSYRCFTSLVATCCWVTSPALARASCAPRPSPWKIGPLYVICGVGIEPAPRLGRDGSRWARRLGAFHLLLQYSLHLVKTALVGCEAARYHVRRHR